MDQMEFCAIEQFPLHGFAGSTPTAAAKAKGKLSQNRGCWPSERLACTLMG